MRGLAVVAALVLLGFVATRWVVGGEAFGARPEGARLAGFEQSPQWRDGAFANPEAMWSDMTDALLNMLSTTPGDVPAEPVPVVRSQGETLRAPPPTGLRVTWFGHSSTLVEIDGVRLLTDPIWSERPSPFAALGPKRFFEPPIPLDRLGAIDAVVISHDHYDHLDRPTIVAMAGWKTLFIVPLGIGAHLERWGVPPGRIVELDWWQSTRVGPLAVTATPSRHASGRLNPRSDHTLWSGFAFAGPRHRVFYSGDTGLTSAAAEVGWRLGPFDLALVEAGQYDADWPDWHLGPEQAVQVARSVRAERLMPVHWALFKLAHHGWTEPVERVLAAASCVGQPVLTPRPGESIEPTAAAPGERWWPRIDWRTADQKPIVATRDGDPAKRVAPFHCPG